MSGRPASSGKGVAVQGLKLPFAVVFASSADEGFDARQLEAKPAAPAVGAGGTDEKQAAPTHIKGWQSAKFCSYPQTLVLRFPGYFDIRKIQILSHQAKIANTIELYAGVSPTLEDPDDARVSYQRLGYLSLDSNERSQFKARELKSVYVNARGNFLKLTIRKAHVNQINQCNQVGIIAINVVGTRAPEGPSAPIHVLGSGGQQGSAASSSGENSHRTMLAGLIAQYQCDEKTAQKIYDLERLKSQAVAAEEYDEAKRLKIHLETLKELSGKLAQLEAQKIQAVQREDFDAAKQIKKEIDYLRGNAAHAHQQRGQQHQQPQHHSQHLHHQQQQSQPMHTRMPSQKITGTGGGGGNRRGSGDGGYQQQPPQHGYDQQHDAYDPPISLQQDGSGHPHDDAGGNYHHDHPHDNDGQGQSGGAPNPAEDPNLTLGDERPLKPSRNALAGMMPNMESGEDGSPAHPSRKPAMHAASYDPTDDDEGGANAMNSSSLPPPEQLSAVNRKDAEPLLDIFGEHAVLSLYSKHWQLRHSALKDIAQSVADNSNDVPVRELFSACCRVLKKGLADKVSQVFLSACQLLQTLLSNHAMKLRPEEVKSMLEPMVHTMLDKLSSSNVRERDGGMQVLAFLAFDSHVHPSLVPSAMLQPLKKKEVDSPLPLKGRAKLLLRCIVFYGLDESFGLSAPALIKFVSPHLLHRDAGVRDGMFNLLAGMSTLSGMNGSKVLAQLKDVRPQTLETLQAKMDDVASGAMQFTKPSQPSLDVPYISEHDATHTLHGQPVTGPAGVSAPTAASASASSAVQSSGYMAAPSAAPPARKQQAAATPAAAAPHGKQAHANPHQQQQPQQQQQKGGGKHPDPPPHQQQHPRAGGVDSSIAEEELSADLSGKCQFCGLEDPTFTEEKLDLHYWQDCPILIQCKQCDQVIEIPTLSEHLLHECESGGHKECPQCHQPVLASHFAAHTDARTCRPPAANMARCALCEREVDKSDEGWKQHLIVERCPKNTRQVK